MKIIEKIIRFIPFICFGNKYSTQLNINNIYENDEMDKIKSFEIIPNLSSIEIRITR